MDPYSFSKKIRELEFHDLNNLMAHVRKVHAKFTRMQERLDSGNRRGVFKSAQYSQLKTFYRAERLYHLQYKRLPRVTSGL